MKDLKCPFCKGDLKVTHQEHYQDLAEHVSDPNGTPSLKDGYECLNESCLAFGTFNWIEDGDYFSNRPEKYDYMEWRRIKMEANGGSDHYYAVGSWNYYYQMGKDAIKAKTFKINLGLYKFVFSPREKGWDYPEEIRHMPNLLKWKVEIWKKSNHNSYTNVIPFHRMFLFCLKEFASSYKRWKETGNTSSLEKAYEYATTESRWGRDDRFYRRASSAWIKLFNPKKFKEVVEAKSKKC